MKKKLSVILLLAAITASGLSHAQNSPLSYEAGINGYLLKGFQDPTGMADFRMGNSGTSPYIGLTYHLPDSLPLSLGLRANIFKIEVTYFNNEHLSSPFEKYSYLQSARFIQLQFPVAYHWYFQHQDLSLGVTPTLYIGIQKGISYQVPTKSAIGNIHSKGYSFSYDYPEFLSANFDLSLSYSYYFTQIGKHELGVTAFASYPLLRSLKMTTRYSFSAEIEPPSGSPGGKVSSYEFSEDVAHYFTPLTFGIGLTFR